MKATGIVRRIDDLGRVIIPKEIRRTLKLHEGDPLEIFTDTDNGVIFKKYSPFNAYGYEKARNILRWVIPMDIDFALYNNYGEYQTSTNKKKFTEDICIREDECVPDYCYEVRGYDYDIVAYIHFGIEIEDSIKENAIKIIKELFKNNY